ncbi:excisionase family DNA-binding protein [Bradyrhizobium aeschynomenes]|uniref:excisionase family DNA-binding protein n=1 Tax=Bradyrhizobium aeschynomenes TaxID=2734909 RepID=UPI003D31C419
MHSFDHGGSTSLTRRGRDIECTTQTALIVTPEDSKRHPPDCIPFAQRLTCTVAEACEATGLGRTKIYELIGNGRVKTTTIGRRRLVVVQSLLSLVGINAVPANSR